MTEWTRGTVGALAFAVLAVLSWFSGSGTSRRWGTLVLREADGSFAVLEVDDSFAVRRSEPPSHVPWLCARGSTVGACSIVLVPCWVVLAS